MNEASIRQNIQEKLRDIGGTIKLEELLVALDGETKLSVADLIGVLEEDLFRSEAGQFHRKLFLHPDKRHGITRDKVAENKFTIDDFRVKIYKVIEIIEQAQAKVRNARFTREVVGEAFLAKKDDYQGNFEKLTQLIALLQSYLDLFKEWEIDPGYNLEMSNQEATQKIVDVEKVLNEVLIGQEDAVRQVIIGIFTGGHILLEGASGLGKTSLAKTLARVLGLQSSRIQFTSDTMPADILDPSANSKYGKLFTNVVLADEINRASPKTQSALLEAMEEQTLTNGETVRLPIPHLVIATQNPHDGEGTRPLPLAQIDRFAYSVRVKFPEREALPNIRDTKLSAEQVEEVVSISEVLAIKKAIEKIPVSSSLIGYVAAILYFSHPEKEDAMESVKENVANGASVRAQDAIIRGAQVLTLLSGRGNVSKEDINEVAYVALRHRIRLNQTALSKGISVESVIAEILEKASQI